MTLLVKNERDIVEANLDYHLSRGVDHVVVTDNASDDGTREILATYARRAPLTIIDEPGDDYSQGVWVTRMALMAREKLGADWILNNDADEFWHFGDQSLKNALAPERAPLQICRRHNMVMGYDAAQSSHWIDDLIYCAADRVKPPKLDDIYNGPLDRPFFLYDLAPKALVRSEGLVSVDQGNHNARYDRPAAREDSLIGIYHYPVRSIDQFASKIGNGGAAYARNKALDERIGWHWRRLYALMERKGIEFALNDALPSAAQIHAGLDNGTICEDRTLCAELGQQARYVEL